MTRPAEAGILKLSVILFCDPRASTGPGRNEIGVPYAKKILTVFALACAAAAGATITAAANFPNPAKAATTLRVELSRSNVTEARFAVYDLSGRKVRELKAAVKANAAEVAWDLADSSGARIPPGVYIWRVEVGPASVAKKCVVN